jgi:hypothetical protein
MRALSIKKKGGYLMWGQFNAHYNYTLSLIKLTTFKRLIISPISSSS